MTRQEVEDIVLEMKRFANQDSDWLSFSGTFRLHLQHIVTILECTGYHPWPKMQPIFETWSVETCPEYSQFLDVVTRIKTLFEKVKCCGDPTEKQTIWLFILWRQLREIFDVIEKQIPYPPVDPRYLARKNKESDRVELLEFETPNLPITNCGDIDNALREMYNFFKVNATRKDSLGEAASYLQSIGFHSAFVGYPKESLWMNQQPEIPFEECSEYPIFLGQFNKCYRLFSEINRTGIASDRQIGRLFRINLRIQECIRTATPRMKSGSSAHH